MAKTLLIEKILEHDLSTGITSTTPHLRSADIKDNIMDFVGDGLFPVEGRILTMRSPDINVPDKKYKIHSIEQIRFVGDPNGTNMISVSVIDL